jgi:membrane associated rhomboid family serine protease/tetratricopeptide (TPR) repeat protein
MSGRPILARMTAPAPGSETESGRPAGDRWPLMQPVYRPPLVTYTLIGVNVALWLAAAALDPNGLLHGLWDPDPNALLQLGAKYGPSIQAGQYWRLITAMFLHGGLFHLAVNMWALLQLGTLSEILYGRARFLVLYVCSGVLGNLASYKLSPELGVGASGAIFGLLGVAIVFSVKYRHDLPPGLGDRMRRSLMPVLLLNLALTFSVPVIDKWAHLGGLITGALLAAVTESQNARPERRAREALPMPLAWITAAALLGYGAWGLAVSMTRVGVSYAAAAAVRRGHPEVALRLLQRAVARDPADLDARRSFYLLLVQQRQWPEATREALAFSHSKLPSDAIRDVLLPVATALAEARRGKEAETVYLRLLQVDPGYFWSLNGLAYLYADVLETKLPEAERMARQALENMPGNSTPLSEAFWGPKRGAILDTLAWVLFKEGKLKEADEAQRQAVRLTGDNAEIRYHMGRILEARGDLPAARHEYEFALRQNRGYLPARRALERLRSQPVPPPTSRPPATAPPGEALSG